jgi:hypothetical protein
MKPLTSLFFLILTISLSAQKNGIVFRENFESASIEEMLVNWNDSDNTMGMSYSSDIPAGSKGKQSLMMTYTPGSNSGGFLYKMFPEGFDTLYARFYVKFITNYSKVHHFSGMGGLNPPSEWPIGRAGIKPKGNEKFNTSVEPAGDKWSWDFYTYWMNMHGYADPDFFWGNSFNPDPPAKVVHNEWICVEIMVILNNPVEQSNGEQAFWINGKEIIRLGRGFPSGYWKWDSFIPSPGSGCFEGFQWRNNDSLKINYFNLGYYMTDGKSGEIDKVLFDDVVVSTNYIGPLKRDF